tara:strand:- start:258 stop:449 length:192 start_codon:yes stop_codon:yes gene_type:complete
MIDFIKSFFKRDPATKIRKAIKKKYKSAMQMQRNGKLREFAEIMKEIETLEKQYDEVFDENRR